jgi:hypothetical protein
MERKAFSTRAGYESYLKGWIVPRWGDLRIDQIKSGMAGKHQAGKRDETKDPNIMSGILPSRDALRVG